MQPITEITPLVDEFAPGTSRGAAIPWWGKVAAKVVLSRLLPSYTWRRKLGLFRHSYADSTGRGKRWHLARFLARHEGLGAGGCDTVVELGPGDTVANALYAAGSGARRIWLIDSGDFASRDMARYAPVARKIKKKYRGFRTEIDLSSREAMLESVGARYLTGGLGSLAHIPDSSVDLVFSVAVMEHVRRAEFDALIAEMFRILRPGGTAHHTIDLTDHLGGKLNSLQFAPAVWEHPLFAEAGFYTNRLRYTEIVQRFRASGFEVAVPQMSRWNALPTPRHRLAQPFRALPDDELLIATFHLCARKPASEA
jgi:SAM-dependent methyltransferase